MSVLRAFIAIELPEEVQQRLDAHCQALQKEMAGLPLRWVPVPNIHLTLKFLGDVSETNLKTIADILASSCGQYPPMEISLGGMGVFPDLRRPRVLWVGVEAPDELQHLQERLEAETERLGYPPEKREFSPHLTVARVKRGAARREQAAISQQVQAQKLGFLAAAVIDEVSLIKSELKASGAVYTTLSSAKLSA
jgi:2'-5' RNA ligase